MKNSHRLILGLLITATIIISSSFFGKQINTGITFFSSSFGLHTTMLILSILAIVLMKKHLEFKMRLPKLKTIWKPILIAIITTISVNLFISMLGRFVGGSPEEHPVTKDMDLAQIIIFVFFYASIAEEFLHRGFLLNLLKPLKNKGVTILKRHISLPVIITGLTFGLMHLGTASFGVSTTFLVQIVTFTTILGVIAGYYQEKYDNFSYAIIVHMAGNFVGIVGMVVMSLSS